jgi:hypothetical protein
MIVMVSTNTLSARDPDQSARTKPIEMTSYRPPRSTSFSVGWMILSTVSGVSPREARSRTVVRTSSIWLLSSWENAKPIEPASAKISGGSDRIAKNAASAASPVTR